MSTPTVQQPRSPERVLSTIAATARLDGMQAPRRISFDESTPTTPLAVLSLTWLSLADMRPWLVFFGAGETHTYRRDDGTAHYTAYADYYGWSLSLNALDSVRCTCGAERVHMLGCPAVAQCPATWYGGWCPGEVRHDDGRCDTHTSHNLTYDAPTVEVPTEFAKGVTHLSAGAKRGSVCRRFEFGRDSFTDRAEWVTCVPCAAGGDTLADVPEHLADHFAVLNPDAPIPYVPVVHWVTASGRNMCFDRRVETQGTRDATKATCPDCREVYSYTAEALDEPIPYVPVPAPTGVQANADEAARLHGETVHHVPADVHPRGHEPTWRSDHQPTDRDARIVDVLTIDPELADDGRGGAGIERIAGASPATEVEAFNAAWPVGTVVDYWRGVYEGEPSGRGATRTPAQVLSGHTAVVWIEGCSGCIALSHVRPAPYASDQHLYAEARDRLQTVRDDATFAGIVEASGE